MRQLDDCLLEIQNLHDTFKTGLTKKYKFRMEQLKALRLLLAKNKIRLIQAMMQDFKGEPQALLELDSCLFNVDYALKNLYKWMQPTKKSTSLPFKLDSAYVFSEPRGVLCIIGPWNYPLAMLVDPLIGAIAAGNCAFLKASSQVPHTSDLLEEIFPEYLSSAAFKLMHINALLANSLIQEGKFDFIFFTGGYSVGQKIYEMAARNFTPVLMELGGKSPCIITKHADMKSAINRISWGKYINSGQTCIAPDFVLATSDAIELGLVDMFVDVAKEYSATYYNNENKARIVSQSQCERLENILNEIPNEWKFHVGKIDKGSRSFEPAIIFVSAEQVKQYLNSKSQTFELLKNEIFGPILPILDDNLIAREILFNNNLLSFILFKCINWAVLTNNN